MSAGDVGDGEGSRGRPQNMPLRKMSSMWSAEKDSSPNRTGTKIQCCFEVIMADTSFSDMTAPDRTPPPRNLNLSLLLCKAQKMEWRRRGDIDHWNEQF